MGWVNTSKTGMLLWLSVAVLTACSDQQAPTSPSSSKAGQQAEAIPAQSNSTQTGKLPLQESGDRQWVEGWYPASAMLTKRAGAAAVVENDTIYMIGGVDGRNFLRTTEYAKMRADGSLGDWQAGPMLNEERGFIDAIVRGDYIYVVGGGNGPNGEHLLRSVERAKINADGSLGAWETEQNQMLTPRRCSKVLAVGQFIYSLGGFAGTLLDTVERARFMPDGHLGEWELEDQHMTIPRYIDTVKSMHDALYVIGGHDQVKGVGITDVEWAKPQPNGVIKSWTKASPLQVGRYGLTSAKHGNRVYALGGLTGLEYLDTVETTQINEKGEPGAWRYTTPLSVPRATFSAVSYKDKIYVLGGTNEDHYLNNVEFATVNDQGDLGFWGTAQDAKDYAAFKEQIKQRNPGLPNQGVVEHVQQASMYTYINVSGNLGDIWLAGPKLEVKVGDRIQFSKGVSMSNFYSKELQQQFPVILFVSKVQVVK